MQFILGIANKTLRSLTTNDCIYPEETMSYYFTNVDTLRLLEKLLRIQLKPKRKVGSGENMRLFTRLLCPNQTQINVYSTL